MSKRATVIAHFDPAGEARPDFINLVRRLADVSEKTVVVSTNLAPYFQEKLEAICQVITPPQYRL